MTYQKGDIVVIKPGSYHNRSRDPKPVEVIREMAGGHHLQVAIPHPIASHAVAMVRVDDLEQ